MSWVVDPLKPTPLKMNIKRARPRGAVAFFCCRKIITTRGLCDTLLPSTGRINYSGSIHFAWMSRCSLTFVYIYITLRKKYMHGGRGNSSLFFPHSSVAVSHSKLQTRGPALYLNRKAAVFRECVFLDCPGSRFVWLILFVVVYFCSTRNTNLSRRPSSWKLFLLHTFVIELFQGHKLFNFYLAALCEIWRNELHVLWCCLYRKGKRTLWSDFITCIFKSTHDNWQDTPKLIYIILGNRLLRFVSHVAYSAPASYKSKLSIVFLV